MKKIQISEIESFNIGHAQNFETGTGCTVILCKNGAVTGVDVRGGAPGTRETDLLNPINMIPSVHGILLTGGSAFGLDAAAGIMEYLEQHDIGFDVGVTKVPIVCGAALFDLPFGNHTVRPDKNMGEKACISAEKTSTEMGNIGAGTGATVGKINGMENAMKGGLGWFSVVIGELKIGAIVAVNCFGSVVDPETGEMIAGPFNSACNTIEDTEKIMMKNFNKEQNVFTGNTTIGTVITNGYFNKAQCTKLAGMAQNGFARTLRPAHTMVDGDTIFFMSSGNIKTDQNLAGTLAAKVMERAVVMAIKNADTLHGAISYKQLKRTYC